MARYAGRGKNTVEGSVHRGVDAGPIGALVFLGLDQRRRAGGPSTSKPNVITCC